MNIKSLMPFSRERTSLARPDHASFSSLQREIDRLFEDFTRGFAPLSGSALIPSMDVSETEKEVEISAELPGLEEKDVEVALEDDILTIKGEKKAEKTEEKGKDYRVTERSYGSFYRAIELPHGIDAKDIKASMANGVLKITLPKPKRSNARKIAIKAKS
jgi:HSP20 family protein